MLKTLGKTSWEDIEVGEVFGVDGWTPSADIRPGMLVGPASSHTTVDSGDRRRKARSVLTSFNTLRYFS